MRNRLFGMSGRLSSKRALVTGASSGIGREVASRFAAEGAQVACAGRDQERTQQTADRILSAGGVAFAVLGDVSTPEGADAVVAGAVKAMGGLDALVSNAGVDATDWRDVADWELAEFDRILATNLRGPFLVARAAIPHMLDNDPPARGAIVHMSSVCAITVWAGDCAYDVSKAGLNMLSDHIAVEYGSRGIRSNTLMPGVIRTELHDSVMEAMNDDRAFERELLGRHPIGRFGTVQDIADACVFLCADEAQFLTGANISIDGAYSRV
jgi:NAD(P)-dependent dehydrogenase (short-subunit alcohol dehydrogenase family)